MNLEAEWLETDGRGGFASGTVGGARSRRYHGLLLPATRPPVARMVLVNGIEAWLETPAGRYPVSTQCYQGGVGQGDVFYPRGQNFIVDFQADPWPQWTYQFPDGSRLRQEIFIHRRMGLTVLAWHLQAPPSEQSGAGARLQIWPLLSGRDYHSLQRENPAFAADPVAEEGASVLWQPYQGVPGTRLWCSGAYQGGSEWYRNFLYTEERARGLDYLEDLVAPGVFACDLGAGGTATLLLGAVIDPAAPPVVPLDADLASVVPALRAEEQSHRASFPALLLRSGDAYLVRGERGATVIAGYPWFTDWGRDTFIALRGLCLAAGRLEEAREILLQWSAAVSEGMLPNRFPDGGEAPEYNTVDAALWFIVVAHEYLEQVPEPTDAAASARNTQDARQLLDTCEAILEGYAAGTRYGIRLDPADGLLLAGEPGVALTWMDARVDGRAITPRIGKPVEIQALWLNALALLAPKSARWQALYAQGREQFQAKFWNEARGCLYDVIDNEGRPGQTDGSLRPNQIFAVGGLPLVLLDEEPARAVVESVERALLTPLGLRSLAAGEPGYAPRYGGGPAERDGAYHQGTVWPWLLGPFVEAWTRVRGNTPAARAEARTKYLEPILALLPSSQGLNHLTEIADAEPPHAPRGCPFQAWSLGEMTRLAYGVLHQA
jgi:predicted glycogen debranching enzyme